MRIQLLEAAADCLNTALGPIHIKSGFRKAGLWPFDKDVPLSSPLLHPIRSLDYISITPPNRSQRLDEEVIEPRELGLKPMYKWK